MEEMKLGFSEQALRCPRLRLLIYELVEEISHLSLFISFLQAIFFLCRVQLSLKSSATRKRPKGNKKYTQTS